MGRQTKTLETKFGKNKVEIKEYLIESENRELLKILSGVVKIEDDKPGVNDTGLLMKYQDKLVEIWVVSIDEETDDLSKKILDMRREDYRQVIDEINKIANLEEKKTKK